MYEMYSNMALIMSIGSLIVATLMTLRRTSRIIDILFTSREWMLSVIFFLTFLVTQGPEDQSYDLFHNQVRGIRLVFMILLTFVSLLSVGAILYNTYWRMRINDQSKEDTEHG